MKAIGPDLGVGGNKYNSGIRADNGSIYCLPSIHCIPRLSQKWFLKITPLEGGDAEVGYINEKFPKQNLPLYDFNICDLWKGGVLAGDGCIYYMPLKASHILKLDTNDGDKLSLVGKDLGRGLRKYIEAILGDNDCIYGIPESGCHNIIKFDPKDHQIHNVGGPLNRDEKFLGGVKAADGNIYIANHFGQMIQIDTVENKLTVIGEKINSKLLWAWDSPILGKDKCIYFPPFHHDRVLFFNPSTQNISLIGDMYTKERRKWKGTVLASDGFIYCVPYRANQILRIDSRHVNEQVLEFCSNFNARMKEINTFAA